MDEIQIIRISVVLDHLFSLWCKYNKYTELYILRKYLKTLYHDTVPYIVETQKLH